MNNEKSTEVNSSPSSIVNAYGNISGSAYRIGDDKEYDRIQETLTQQKQFQMQTSGVNADFNGSVSVNSILSSNCCHSAG
jgi:hypothetical protein